MNKKPWIGKHPERSTKWTVTELWEGLNGKNNANWSKAIKMLSQINVKTYPYLYSKQFSLATIPLQFLAIFLKFNSL